MDPYPPTNILEVREVLPSFGERKTHALAKHYVVADLFARQNLEVSMLDERVEDSLKMGRRRIIEFEVEGLFTTVPNWQIEANRYLCVKRDCLLMPGESFTDYGGREAYKHYCIRNMCERIGIPGAAAIAGICAGDYLSWKEEVFCNLGYRLSEKRSLFKHFQGIRERLDDFSGAISRKDYYLEVTIENLLKELGIPHTLLKGLIGLRDTTLDQAEFRVVREMNGQLVTVYPLVLRYSGDC